MQQIVGTHVRREPRGFPMLKSGMARGPSMYPPCVYMVEACPHASRRRPDHTECNEHSLKHLNAEICWRILTAFALNALINLEHSYCICIQMLCPHLALAFNAVHMCVHSHAFSHTPTLDPPQSLPLLLALLRLPLLHHLLPLVFLFVLFVL